MTTSDIEKIHLKNLPLKNLREVLMSTGEPKFRAEQTIKWIYQKRISSFTEMRNIAKTTQEKFTQLFTINKLEAAKTILSKRGDAVKFAFSLIATPYCVESVLLIDGTRRTACLSSQLGCGLGCTFCETAKLGFIRNLTQEEIIGQLIGIDDFCARHDGSRVSNVVFMGMGEALANFEHFRSSLSIIMDEECFNIGARRITVSTAGVIPSIERLMKEDLTIGLAISLNAWSNEVRSKTMPINRKYPIEQLVAIAKRYFEQTGRRVTFEYVLIEGDTDTMEAAGALHKMLLGIPCKINLIPVNAVNGSALKTPSKKRVLEFAEILHGYGLAATVRASRGTDISGACGQLTASLIEI